MTAVPVGVLLRPGYDFGNEFEFGLTVILDALTRSIPDDSSERAPDRR